MKMSATTQTSNSLDRAPRRGMSGSEKGWSVPLQASAVPRDQMSVSVVLPTGGRRSSGPEYSLPR